MARVDQILMDQRAFGKDRTNDQLDFTHGGMFGWSPELKEWISNQGYVRRNLVPIVLECPKFFDRMPNPDVWRACFKSLIEKHCRTIDGYQAGVSATFDSHPVGGAGEEHQEITDMKRARSEPVFTFIEKYGRPIQTFLNYWLRYGMMDPDTKFALVSTLEGGPPDDMLADQYTGTILVFEPDYTHTKVEKAWITTNFAPQNEGEVIGRRDLTAASEILTLTIPFTGISQYGLGPMMLAQEILNNIRKANADPYKRPAIVEGVHADLVSAPKGYKQGLEDLGSTAVSVS